MPAILSRVYSQKILKMEDGKMGKSDWDINGPGGQGIIDDAGSMRCQLTATKNMTWNGDVALTDSEVITEIKLNSTNGYSRVGPVLRADETCENGYFCLAYGYATKRYYIFKVVDGVKTQLAYFVSEFASSLYTKIRFRIDGYQLSIEEWKEGDWVVIGIIEDTDETHPSGRAGLRGESLTTYYGLFDNVEIGEKT